MHLYVLYDQFVILELTFLIYFFPNPADHSPTNQMTVETAEEGRLMISVCSHICHSSHHYTPRIFCSKTIRYLWNNCLYIKTTLHIKTAHQDFNASQTNWKVWETCLSCAQRLTGFLSRFLAFITPPRLTRHSLGLYKCNYYIYPVLNLHSAL